ncbi:hypothetical protein [Rheinheimera sp.]|uniref:hypothetical protein n=1 Tax=Rheinheimera sp. TaxID=1869214 RepID=UPI004048DEB7
MKIPKIVDHIATPMNTYKTPRLVISIALALTLFIFTFTVFKTLNFTVITMPPVAAWIAYCCLGIAIDEFRYNKARKLFQRHLSDIDVALLSKFATSPEMTKDERNLIIEHLNVTNPGWSVCATGQ